MQELADRSSVHVTSLYRLLRGQHGSPEVAQRVADNLGVRVEDIAEFQQATSRYEAKIRANDGRVLSNSRIEDLLVELRKIHTEMVEINEKLAWQNSRY